jgi:hypothetical protein
MPARLYSLQNSEQGNIMYAIEDYRRAPSGEGPLAAEWKDKPHRLIYDLCKRVEALESKGFGCHCDLEPGMQPDGCVLLDGVADNCVYAQRLREEGKGPSACEYWRPIQLSDETEKAT